MPTKTEPQTVGLEAFEEAWADFFGSVRRSKGRVAKEEGGLTFSQHYLLAALDDHPGMPTGELALAAGVSPPTATRMLDGLERDGIVTREASAEDRRKVTIRLTDEGRKIVRRKQRQVSARRRAVFESLSDSEREQAVQLMHRLAGLIEEL